MPAKKMTISAHHKLLIYTIAGVAAFCFILLFVPSIHAQDQAAEFKENQTADNQKSEPPSWTALKKGAMNLGLTAGAGSGAAVLGSNERHDLALIYLHYGYGLTDHLGQGRWYHGALEFSCEPFGGVQYHPEDRYVFGVMLGLRYNFLTPTAWVPFVEGGVGPSLTDIGEPDLSTTFQFNTQVGLGTHYFIRDTLALTLQARGIHLSNAYIERPNFGSNTVLFLGGLSWFF